MSAEADDDKSLWSWKVKAACKDLPKGMFFPESWESNRPAKEVCASCEVRHECLVFAIETNQRHGVWGGLSERERRGVKRLRRQASG